MTTLATLSPDIARFRVIGTADAAEFCDLSVKTLRRMNDRGAMPAPIRLSERRIGWRIGDLIDWLDCREKGLEWHVYRSATHAPNGNQQRIH